MILKAVSFFLIGIAVLAIFGRLRMPKLPGKSAQKSVPKAIKCPKCRSYVLPGTTCNCGYKADKR
ncbi:hypothetical protein [Halovulum sp. GXIMD14793]